MDWRDLDQTDIRSLDSIELVVILEANEVIAWATVDRPAGSTALGDVDVCRAG